MTEQLALYLWIGSWVACSLLIGARTRNGIYSVGGGFVASLLLLLVCLWGYRWLYPSGAPERPAPTEAVALTKPPEPQHFYSIADGGEYGYEPARTQQDIEAGVAATSFVMVRYLGTRDGQLQIATVLNKYALQVMDCRQPCDIVRVRAFSSGQMISKELIRPDPTAIVALALRDAATSQLKPWQTKDGKFVFYGDDHRRHFYDSP